MQKPERINELIEHYKEMVVAFRDGGEVEKSMLAAVQLDALLWVMERSPQFEVIVRELEALPKP